ncbi:FecR domain-containing protein [Calycomorphotria hydatis]|uniref:Fec operon regulator FecR n=1 Tax=Calycomorphotria hydatis TaxID=2528027 RepID=A0A517TFE0_9PLAN|nr:FecR domain-containing protein [Calycomorphotria hydatis]QDT67085.1 fec operon regulator FecR [Calycomorphotria hydatis]
MNKDAELRSEIMSLANSLMNGMANRKMVGRLNEILSSGVVYRQYYVEYVNLRAGIKERAEQHTAEDCVKMLFENSDAKRKAHQLPIRLIASIAASLTTLAVCIGMLVVWFNLPTAPVGRLTIATNNAEWASGAQSPGDIVRAGEPIILTAGTATIRLNSGAVINLQAPTSLILRHDMHLTLAEGTVAAYVPPEAKGFTVHTDDVELIDLGTEFFVKDFNNTETQVFVRQGRVEAMLLGKQDESIRVMTLTAGHAARFSKADEIAEQVDVGLDWSGTIENVFASTRGIFTIEGDLRTAPKAPVVFTEGTHKTEEHVLIIAERSNVTLDQPLTITTREGQRTIPAGVPLDSYLIHYDATGQTSPRARGAVTFDGEILAVIDQSAALVETDPVFGLENREWSVDEQRGFEPDDTIQISAGRDGVSLHPIVSGANYYDQCRILVQAANH